MERRLFTPVVLVLLVLSAGAAGCASTSINRLLADPGRYRNKDVKLSGAVVDSYSLANRGAYQLDDSTGQLWIVSERGVPRRGARVEVKGRVREGFNLGSFGDLIKLPQAVGAGMVLVESSHKAK